MIIPLRRSGLFVVFFLSGTTALGFEILWSRMCSLAFGGTHLAIITVLTAYMTGLAIGSEWAGRICERVRNPVRMYGAFEWLIGAWSLAFPTLLSWLPDGQFLLGSASSPWTLALFRFFWAFLLLLPPTIMMGATLPLLSQAITRADHPGWDIGLLYTSNTTGAVVGCFVTGFYLLPILGIRTTMYSLAGVNILLGTTMLLLSSRQRDHHKDHDTKDAPQANHQEAPSDAWSPTWMKRILPHQHTALWIVFGWTGGLAMLVQVVWNRTFSMMIGSSTYTFTLILSVFLAGLAAGSWFGSWFADRLKRPTLGISLILLLIALGIWMGVVCMDQLPIYFFQWAKGSDLTPTTLFRIKTWLIASWIALPTLCMGCLFPFIIRAAFQNIDQPGKAVGRFYAINTFGAIIGSFTSGFVWTPLLGLQGTLLFCVVMYVLCSVALLAFTPVDLKGGSHKFLAAAGICLLFLFLWTPSWDQQKVSMGLFRIAHLKRHTSLPSTAPIAYYKEGLYATVTIEKYGRHRALKFNGKTDASSASDMPTQIQSGLLPFLFRPKAKDVAVIGWGSGVTVGAALHYPLKHMDAVEIEPAVIEASKHFQKWNHNPQRDPRLRLHLDDGRNFLKKTPRQYDIIISEPSNPWMSGVSALFTKEFFAVAAQKLRPKGVLCQWMQLYEISMYSATSILKAVHTSFPYVYLFGISYKSHDMLMIASKTPLKLNVRSLFPLIQHPTRKREWVRAGVLGPLDMYPRLIAGPKGVRHLIKDAAINTDDNALVEFRAPIELLTALKHPLRKQLFRALGTHYNPVETLFEGAPPPTQVAERAAFLADLASAYYRYGDKRRGARLLQKASQLQPQHPVVRLTQQIVHTLTEGAPKLEECLKRDAQTPFCRAQLGTLHFSKKAIKAQFKRSKVDPSRLLVEGLLYYRLDKYDDSLERLGRLLRHPKLLRARPGLYYLLGQLFKKQRVWPEALWFTRLYVIRTQKQKTK